jgi:hypothetical protein
LPNSSSIEISHHSSDSGKHSNCVGKYVELNPDSRQGRGMKCWARNSGLRRKWRTSLGSRDQSRRKVDISASLDVETFLWDVGNQGLWRCCRCLPLRSWLAPVCYPSLSQFLRTCPLVSPHPYLYPDEVVETLRMLVGLKRAPPSSSACKSIKVNSVLSCNVRVTPAMASYTSAAMSMLAGDDPKLLRTRGWGRIRDKTTYRESKRMPTKRG